MDIGFETVGYVLLCFFGVPILLWKPHLSIYGLVLITMFPNQLDFQISLGPVNIYTQDLILFFFCSIAGCLIFKRLITKNKIFNAPENANILMIFVFLYILMHVAFILAGLFQGVPPQSTVRRFLAFSGCLYFFFPLLFLRDPEQIRNLLIFLVVMVVIYLAFRLKIFLGSARYQLDITSSGTVRFGSAGMPLIAISLFTMLIWRKKIGFYVLSAIPVAVLILAGHRSIYLALLIALMFVFILTKEVTKFVLFVYLGGFAVLFTLLALEIFTSHSFIGDTISRSSDTFNLENPTSIGRMTKIKDNFYIFTKKPIVGIGYNHEMLPALFPSSSLSIDKGNGRTVQEENVIMPHNFVMRFLSHTGAIGTSLIFAIIYLVLKRGYLFIRNDDAKIRNEGIFIFCSVVFFLIQSLMNTTFFAEGWIFWMLCGGGVLLGESPM